MKFLKFFTLLLGFAGLFSLQACKEECPCDDPSNPECDNFDPCYGIKNINTFFNVRPGDRGFPPPEEWCDLIPCDTFNASSVRFDIPDGSLENSTYEWQIGTETEPRIGKGFEVDFSDYLRDNGWETWIPITLTIRRPMNSCLENPKDTLVSVTRELFFTENSVPIIEAGKSTIIYNGYFSHNSSKLETIQFIQATDWLSKRIDFPVYLTIGLPGIDTFLFPTGCSSDWCATYKHSIIRLNNTRNCETSNRVNLSNLSNNLQQLETIRLDGVKKLKFIWVFDKPTGIERYEFIGTRVE